MKVRVFWWICIHTSVGSMLGMKHDTYVCVYSALADTAKWVSQVIVSVQLLTAMSILVSLYTRQYLVFLIFLNLVILICE